MLPRAAVALAVACLALLQPSCAAAGASAGASPPLRTRRVAVPGSASPATLYEPEGPAAASRPLFIALPGFVCPLPSAVTDALPGGRDVAARTDPAAVSAMLGGAAAPLGAVVAVLDAPRRVSACTLCAQLLAAAASAPANNSDRLGVLVGLSAYLAATAAGARCDGAWDATDACCVPAAQRTPTGDVPFILSAMRAILAATPAADPTRVYIMGVSAGAFMALRAGSEAPPGTFAGVLVYAGGGVPRCAPPAPLPLLLVHGRRDLQVPFGGSGGNGGGAAPFAGAEATLKQWAVHGARCDAALPPTRTARAAALGNNSSSSRLEVVSYTAGCAAQPVEGWFLDTWGHLPPTAGTEMDDVFVSAFRRISSAGGG